MGEIVHSRALTATPPGRHSARQDRGLPAAWGVVAAWIAVAANTAATQRTYAKT
jgi:hypothetical protein